MASLVGPKDEFITGRIDGVNKSLGRITAVLIVLEEDGIRAAATPQTKTKDCFILRTASLSSLYDKLNLNEFQQIILSTMIRLYVLLLSTV